MILHHTAGVASLATRWPLPLSKSHICAGAHVVPPMLSAMSAIVALIALIFRAFGSSMQRFSRMLMMPRDISCGTRNRSLFVPLCRPLSMRPRRHDRFVLIGLCWLNGHSEIPSPSHTDTYTQPLVICGELYKLLHAFRTSVALISDPELCA